MARRDEALVDRLVHNTIMWGATLLVVVSGYLAIVGAGWLELSGLNPLRFKISD